MLPQSYEPVFVLILVASGLVACFAGYRLFRAVLAIYGFILGAMMASSVVGTTNTLGMIAGAVIGGLVGAVVLVFAYFLGVALIGAAIGALVGHVAWLQFGSGEPPWFLVVLACVAGAVGAMLVQRYVIVFFTAFVGAWTLLLGVLALAGGDAARRPAATPVWILYPFAPMPGQRWVPIAWIALGVVGAAVQLGFTGKKRS